MQQSLKNNKLLIVFSLLLFIYALLTFITPPNPEALQKYQLTEPQARLISLTLVIPIVTVWSLAFYGFSRINRYAQNISEHKDGKGFMLIAKGLMWLAISMALRSALSAAYDMLLLERPDLEWLTVITSNYLYVAFALITYILISRGAIELSGIVRLKSTIQRQDKWMLLSGLMSATFTYFVLTRTEESKTYYLPDVVIILTIIIPLVYAWYRGFLASYHLWIFRRRVKGLLYKKGLALLTAGLIVTVISAITIEFLVTVSANLTNLDLTPLLITVYLLVLLIGSSFALIAAGARKLQSIEEI